MVSVWYSCGAFLFLSPCMVEDPNSQTLLVFHCLSIFRKRKVALEAAIIIALYFNILKTV